MLLETRLVTINKLCSASIDMAYQHGFREFWKYTLASTPSRTSVKDENIGKGLFITNNFNFLHLYKIERRENIFIIIFIVKQIMSFQSLSSKDRIIGYKYAGFDLPRPFGK